MVPRAPEGVPGRHVEGENAASRDAGPASPAVPSARPLNCVGEVAAGQAACTPTAWLSAFSRSAGNPQPNSRKLLRLPYQWPGLLEVVRPKPSINAGCAPSDRSADREHNLFRPKVMGMQDHEHEREQDPASRGGEETRAFGASGEQTPADWSGGHEPPAYGAGSQDTPTYGPGASSPPSTGPARTRPRMAPARTRPETGPVTTRPPTGPEASPRLTGPVRTRRPTAPARTPPHLGQVRTRPAMGPAARGLRYLGPIATSQATVRAASRRTLSG